MTAYGPHLRWLPVAVLLALAIAGCHDRPPPAARQCNPVFTRGDVVALKGIPASRFIVIGMWGDCSVSLRNHEGIFVNAVGTDLLTKVTAP